MFDMWFEQSLGDPSALLDLVSDTVATERRAGCRKLRLAAAWADCHGDTGDPDQAARRSVLVDRLVRMGPLGTPLVTETCPSSLALAQRTSVTSARLLIGDALTIRHRLPRLWDRVVAGEVWGWKAREIARRTSELGPVAAGAVDAVVTGQVELLAWGRFERLLDATLLQVDEATYQRRVARAAAQRDVRATQSSDGLRTLVARVEAGDAAAFLALVDRVAECLADDGDEDPVAVRRSRAVGIIAYQPRLRDLLARHADRPDTHPTADVQVAAHQADPTDPWAADLPTAGWETDRHGNVRQPGFDDLDDDCWTSQRPSTADVPDGEPPVDDKDLAWFQQQRDGDGAPSSPLEPVVDAGSVPEAIRDHGLGPTASVPAPFVRQPRGSQFDLRPFTTKEASGCGPRVVIHVHVTDRTLVDQHGVVRTSDGPVTLDQFRQWLTQADSKITIRPILDPAATSAVDAYEIPQRLRQAMSIRHPGSVWPFSPATSLTADGRLDLDHTRPYGDHGPPGQTSIGNLGPLTRTEHRAKTFGGWQARQPDLGTYLWRSPEGLIALTTNQGTLLLGDRDWAHQVWRTSEPAVPAA